MTKRLSLILMLLLVGFMSEAKTTSVKDKVDVAAIHSGTQNGTEPRSETISADITGHTLTITFNDNVGIAHIIIKDFNGVYIDRENVFSTPDYATFKPGYKPLDQ